MLMKLYNLLGSKKATINMKNIHCMYNTTVCVDTFKLYSNQNILFAKYSHPVDLKGGYKKDVLPTTENSIC